MLRGYDIKIPDELLDDEDKIDWTEDGFGFISDVIFGIERQVYKEAQTKPAIKSKLKEMDAMLLGMRLIEFYLTQVYKQLVEKESDIIVEKFEKIGQACDEKPLFMLNLLSNVINKCYPMMPRSKLDPSDEIKYNLSVGENINLMKKYIVTLMTEYLAKLKEAKKNKRIE